MGRIADASARMNVCPLGSGVAGTTYPIDRAMTAAALGFAGPSENSLDGVSDRDFCIELAAAFSTVMMHLSRFSEDHCVVLVEFKFIELDDAFATGSSIMPQKKNPDGPKAAGARKTARVYGDLVTLLADDGRPAAGLQQDTGGQGSDLRRGRHREAVAL